MKIKKLVKLAPMMLLTFLLGLSGCSGSTSADARVNDHPNEADEELQKILAASPFYVRATVPAGTYPGQTETLKTFGIKCLLCVDASMDEQLVYTITKILDESREELISTHPSLSNLSDPEYICSQLPIPLHPGAEKYYTEQGLLKTE